MKRIIQCLIFSSLCSFLLHHVCLGQDTLVKNEKEIVSWLKQNSMPIKYIEAGNGFADLQPLKAILKDVKVVGLGENTHGTKEFFQLKHRLLEFLVKEMGFTAFALEAGYGACEPINNYVLHGKGDLQSVMTAQGYVLWDTKELATMVEWMRTYNQSVAEDKKVAFYGIDFMYNEPARKKVLAYLQQYSPKIAPSADSLFALLSQQEKLWDKEKDKTVLTNARLKILELISDLESNKEKLAAASSSKELDQIVKSLQVMEQWFILQLPGSLPAYSSLNVNRSQAMAENLFYIMENEKPDAKFVVWEHNSHIGDGYRGSGEPNLGHMLKEKLGERYYAIAFEFNQGSYQARFRANRSFGDLKVVAVEKAPKGYLAYYLSLVNKPILFWNLRTSIDNQHVKQWLARPQTMRSFGWMQDNTWVGKVDLISNYDGIIFIEHTSAVQPTKNALETASRGEGL